MPPFTKNLDFNPTVELKFNTIATSHSEQTWKISMNPYFYVWRFVRLNSLIHFFMEGFRKSLTAVPLNGMVQNV